MNYRVFFAVVFSLATFHMVEGQVEPGRIYWGIKHPQSRLFHGNGRLAWSGVSQGKIYDSAHAFYHAQGAIAWDGMKRTRNTWGDPSERGIFYHANRKEAWGGIVQKLNTWGEYHKEGVFYHANGLVAWTGVQQRISTFGDTRGDAAIYHSNGAKAWGGLSPLKNREDSILYYDNGQIAWRGQAVYDHFGLQITPHADYVSLHLGNDSWLYVDREGKFQVSLHLGEGYRLVTSPDRTVLEVLGQTISLD